MKKVVDKILEQVEADISEIDLYGYDIIETSLSIVRHLQSIITGLRNELQTYTFPTQEDEIRFFKVQKPELLGRLLYFHKICRIEMQCPNGSNEDIRKHLIAELDNLTYFFNRNLDFYQYYRSKSTYLDRYYFTRIIVHTLPCMINTTLYEGRQIFGYALIAHNSIKTRIFQQGTTIR